MLMESSAALYDELLAVLSEQVEILPDKPEETHALTLKCLWLNAMGTPMSVQLAHDHEILDLDEAQKLSLRKMVEERCSNIPLAHITQRQNFCGVELLAGPAALVPRKETEILAQAAKEALTKAAVTNPLVIDVCTGCGNLAFFIAKQNTMSRVYASDLSEEAVALAKKNATFLSMEQQVELRCGDLLEPFEEEFFQQQVDLLICNPPYISTAKVQEMPEEISSHEPSLAFDGGPFGIRILQKVIAQAPKFLKKGGYLTFEVGFGQVPALVKRLEKNKDYDLVETRSDETGEGRVIVVRRA